MMALKDNILKFTKGQIDLAGNVLTDLSRSSEERIGAIEILSNFRACHAYPINTFQATLRTKLNKLGMDSLVSQRLKRTPSIIHKLERYSNMRLSQMQDIGGLRAILPSINNVKQLIKIYEESSFQHEKKTVKDYIEQPKDSGYRCYHIVYKYKNKINPVYDGLMIELQIRTKLQHAWATAVETMGIFLNHSLKSSQGPDEWLNFFSLTGNAFAMLEETNMLDKYASFSRTEIFTSVRDEALRLNVIGQLDGFRKVISNVDYDKKQGSIHLVVLDMLNKEVRVRTFPKSMIEQASKQYSEEESQISNPSEKHVVLVSSSSIDGLRKAYPSYFLDTHEFIETIKGITTKKIR